MRAGYVLGETKRKRIEVTGPDGCSCSVIAEREKESNTFGERFESTRKQNTSRKLWHVEVAKSYYVHKYFSIMLNFRDVTNVNTINQNTKTSQRHLGWEKTIGKGALKNP